MNYAIILAGGRGTRFWPLSRKRLPKQFLRINEGKSLLSATLGRLSGVIADKNIFIVTNRAYLKEAKKHLRGAGIPAQNFILEPYPLNTLPAISACAKLIMLKDAGAKLLVLPSDHYIKGRNEFKKTMLEALKISSEGGLCLIGIKPGKLHLGYGYIQTARKKSRGVYYVGSFIEKPTVNRARRLLRGKDIFWNSGIFCFQAKAILREISKYQPRLSAQISRVRSKADVARVWDKIRPVSIDYGVLERSDNLMIIAAKFSWCDLGSWETLSEVLQSDSRGNIVMSDSLSLDCSNNLLYSQGNRRLIATVGISDTVIIDTPDALLVCRKERSQDVKRLVELLKKKRRDCV
ncbi:mannose-1-phosphate guanylyltransferase [Candidatus Omnitrophota bacterium]